MGSTGGQPASELVAGLLDTARASRARTMQEVAGAWQRAGTITRNLILMARSEIGRIERPATDLVTQLHMYILGAGPEAATSRPQPPSPPGDGTPRAPGGWLAGPGHNITSDSGDDPVVTAWHRPGRPSGVRGRPGRCQTRHAASRRPGLGRYVAGDCCGVRKTRSPTGHPVSRDNVLSFLPMKIAQPCDLGLCRLPLGRRRWPPDIEDSSTQVSGPDRAIFVVTGHPDSRPRSHSDLRRRAPSHMTCPVNVSLGGGYPGGRTRRRGQEPAEPPQVRGISVGFSASTTGTPWWSDRAETSAHVRSRSACSSR